MAYSATLTTTNRTAVIVLTGAMDGTGNDELEEKIEKVATLDVRELVLDMSGLTRLSAAGIRAVAYARQRMADDVDVVVAAPSAGVREALRAADLDDSVSIRD